MTDFTRNFAKIVPSIREESLEAISKTSVKGEKLLIPVRDGSIIVYLHRAGHPGRPVIFEFHGGGFVLGDASKDDNLCEVLRDGTDMNIIGVNYRKAPEYPFPAAVNDAYDAVRYFRENAGDYALDRDRIGMTGFSAGATLCTVTAMQAKNEPDGMGIRCQILNYPYLDGVTDPAKKKHHPADLPVEVMTAFNELYFGGRDAGDPYISPLYAKWTDLHGAAAALVLPAAEDALCAESLGYAENLRKAGVETQVHVMSDMHHGFMEDYYNRQCYELLPEDTKALHSALMPQRAQEAMNFITEAARKYLD